MKSLRILFICFALLSVNLKAFAKEPVTFYGKMKEELADRKDLQKHYSFHRRVGSMVRYAPIEYQMLGLAGITTTSFIFKEVLWDLMLRQGEFDMKDAAANFKGLKDGINGRNEMEEHEFRRNLQEVSALTRQLVADTQEELLVQKATIAELKYQNEQLKQLEKLRQEGKETVPIKFDNK